MQLTQITQARFDQVRNQLGAENIRVSGDLRGTTEGTITSQHNDLELTYAYNATDETLNIQATKWPEGQTQNSVETRFAGWFNQTGQAQGQGQGTGMGTRASSGAGGQTTR